MPEETARSLIFQILQGLEHMHRHGCIHRDLKADNILLTEDREVRICHLARF